MAFSNLLMMVFFLLGDSGVLRDYIDTEGYWEDRDVEITLASMRDELSTELTDLVDVDVWIEALGAESYEKREQAVAELKKAGDAARPALVKARSSRDPEVKSRVNKLLTELSQPSENTRNERRQMALLALSRMEGEAAAELYREFGGTGFPSRSEPKEGVAFWSRFPMDSPLLLSLQPIRNQGEVIAELHRSPMIQQQLRKLWLQTGDFEVDRVCFTASSSLLEMSGAGWAVLLVEGAFDPEKVSQALDRSPLIREEEALLWSVDSTTLSLDPEGKFLVMLIHPNRNIDQLEKVELTAMAAGSAEGSGKIPTLIPEIFEGEKPAGNLWAGARLPEAGPGLPGMQAKPKTVSVQVFRNDAAFDLKLQAGFEGEGGAEEMKALFDAQIAKMKLELDREANRGNGDEVEVFSKMLETVRLHTADNAFVMQVQVQDETRVMMVRQMEKMMGMMQQMRQRHEQMRHEQQMQMIE